MEMKVTVATAMVGGTYNNQLNLSAEEMAEAAATGTATESVMVTAKR